MYFVYLKSGHATDAATKEEAIQEAREALVEAIQKEEAKWVCFKAWDNTTLRHYTHEMLEEKHRLERRELDCDLKDELKEDN